MVIVAFLVPAVSTMAAQQLPNPTVAKARAGKNPFRIGRPLVIPHAGGDGFYPENTMVAWEQSMTEGGDVVDIDVSASADE